MNRATEKNELEAIFVDCIEEVRKNIMKRKLKQEIVGKRKYGQAEDKENTEFEEALLRLSQLAKGKIKLSDFGPRDKANLLDLFVNNEKTLLSVYEVLFPHRNLNMEESGVNNKSINHYQAISTLPETNEYGSLAKDVSQFFNDNKHSRNLMLLDAFSSAPASYSC